MKQVPTTGGEAPVIRYFFIRRPVLAAVISIVIVLLGGFCLMQLPIARYPQITPPAVQVSAVYPGATAEDVAQAVAAPIEQQLSGLDGLLYYRSSNSSSGIMNLQVYFDISRDPDLAAVDVQNAIKVAEPQLPEEVRRQGVTIRKSQTDILLVASLYSDDPRFDATYLTNYAKLYVVDELKRLNGVGDATAFGGLDFAMTIRLDPDRMASLGVTPLDVRNALAANNFTSAPGQVKGDFVQINIDAKTSLETPESFGKLVVMSRGDSLVRLADVAEIELGPQSAESSSAFDGLKAVFIGVYATPTANPLTVITDVRKAFPEIQRELPPGLEAAIAYDATNFIRASLWEVMKTLGEAALIVIVVIFLFLGNLRSTIIPIVTIPLYRRNVTPPVTRSWVTFTNAS